MSRTKKLAMVTLGCKVNQYDTDTVVTQFLDAGYTLVDFREAADVYLINTCTVTNLGDRKSRQMIRRAHRNNPKSKVVVMGCLAQTSPEDIAEIEGVSLIVGTDKRNQILAKLESLEWGEQDSLVDDIFSVTAFEDMSAEGFSDRTRATLKIQDGCNQFCSYCRVPYARGRSRSRERASVLNQVEQIVAQGYKEIVLTGIHLGLYGQDFAEPLSLAQISQEIAATPGLLRLRISSVDPHEITDELMELLATDPVICRHVHVPLQSGSDAILKRMRRNYGRADFRQIVHELRRRVPGIAITTDIMVGFPGETEEDFSATMEFAEEMAFGKIHVFQYSPRSGTRAAEFPQQIPGPVKECRSKRLIELGKRLARDYHQSFVGQTVQVLVEQVQDHEAVGHTDNYLKVTFPHAGDLVGQIVPAQILSATSEGVQAKLAP